MVIRPSQNADVHSMSCIYVQTWQDTYLKTEHLPVAVEIMDVETYGWLDTTLIDD